MNVRLSPIGALVGLLLFSSAFPLFAGPWETADRSIIVAHNGAMSTAAISGATYAYLYIGDVVIYKTNQGRYGKLRIDQRIPMSGTINEILVISWTTYNADGSAYSSGVAWNGVLEVNVSCDLDQGLGIWDPADTRNDFRWSDMILTPQNGATFMVYRGNLPPTANAGPDQTVTDTDRNGSHSVTLSGSGSSDSDGSIANYVWREGSTQVATGAAPTVTLATGIHTITLTVTDNVGATATDTTKVTVNVPPVANAGPDKGALDSNRDGFEYVTLDGSGSYDPDGTITSYVWREEGGIVAATGPTPTIAAPDGESDYTLTVTDNNGATSSDIVLVMVTVMVYPAPTANAGPDQTVIDTDRNGSQPVTLSGSGTPYSGGSIASYVWKEAGAQIATGAAPTVTLGLGVHTITLTVTDDVGGTGTDDVAITVDSPPTANAGSDQTVTDEDRNGSQAVTLNGSASTDSDGTISSYSWSEGGTIATGATPTVTLAVGTHTITLTVTDNLGATSTDTVSVTIDSPPLAVSLKCDGKVNPNNVSTYTPTFGWGFSDADAGDSQSAYQLRVGSTVGAGDVWDTTKSTSTAASRAYGGSTVLQPNVTYYWQVQVWDQAGHASGYTSGTFIILDIGLRLYDGTETVKIAVDYVGSSYALRIYRNGVTYGIILVDTSDPSASSIRIMTSSGPKALKKM